MSVNDSDCNTLLLVKVVMTGLSVVTLLLVCVNDRSDCSYVILLVSVTDRSECSYVLLLANVLMTDLTVVMYYYL